MLLRTIFIAIFCLISFVTLSVAQEIRAIPLHCNEKGWSGVQYDAADCHAWEGSFVDREFGPDSIHFTARRDSDNALTITVSPAFAMTDSLDYPELGSDTLWIVDLNNDGMKDILVDAHIASSGGIGSSYQRWILLMRNRLGGFAPLDVDALADLPVKRIEGKNYFECATVEEDHYSGSFFRFIVLNLFELNGTTFKNVGKQFGYPKIEPDGDEPIPKLSKAERMKYFASRPGEIF